MRTKGSKFSLFFTQFSLMFFLLTACTQGGLGPNGILPMGSALDGMGLAGQGATDSDSSADEFNEGDTDEGTGISDSLGVLEHAPTLDVGEVAPMPDVGLEPIMSFGTSKIICRTQDDKVLFEMSGHLREGNPDDNDNSYHDIDPGELGMTFRVVDREAKDYIDFKVNPVPHNNCKDESTCVKNNFVARFITEYPFPTNEKGAPILQFWLSEPNHEAAIYNEKQTCPEALNTNSLKAAQYYNKLTHPGANSFCHPQDWGQVWTQFHTWENPPSQDNIPPCLLIDLQPMKVQAMDFND